MIVEGNWGADVRGLGAAGIPAAGSNSLELEGEKALFIGAMLAQSPWTWLAGGALAVWLISRHWRKTP